MERKSLIDNKKILIVDDEPDVLESLEELLSMCNVSKAHSFNEAKRLLESQYFDIAILDIMGVNGYELLETANQKNVIAVMLTAHSLSPEDTVKSFKKGAAFYIPKDKVANITTFLKEILDAKEKDKSPWWRWLDHFASFYDKRFGPDWREKDKGFWDKLTTSSL